MAELADRQHGVVSIRQLTGPLGYSRPAVSRAVKSGRLHLLYRGVYAVGHTRISTEGKCLAATLTCGPGALLSHYSAGWLWGIARVDPEPFHVTTAAWRKPRPPIHLHEARLLAAEDRALREGIPVTSLARTLLDLAATVRFEWLEKMVERSEELGLFDLRAVEELLARTVGHHGHKPEHRFAVELDVFETHGTRAAFERDRKRHEDLFLAGIQMIRVTGPRLQSEPDEVIRRVARLLSERGPYPAASTPSGV